jgi:hypothetical protein
MDQTAQVKRLADRSHVALMPHAWQHGTRQRAIIGCSGLSTFAMSWWVAILMPISYVSIFAILYQ